jgi:hypothetical protein
VACNFQIGKNNIKQLTKYEILTQKVLLSVESIMQNAKQLQHAQFYVIVFGLKIIGHGNPDNNLESHCITANSKEVLSDSSLRAILSHNATSHMQLK